MVRPLTDYETILIQRMLAVAAFDGVDLTQLLVEEIGDPGMGGLRFCYPRSCDDAKRNRDLVRMVFPDADGVEVQLVLDVDIEGKLHELDIWKVDNTPVLRWPDVSSIAIVSSRNLSEH